MLCGVAENFTSSLNIVASPAMKTAAVMYKQLAPTFTVFGNHRLKHIPQKPLQAQNTYRHVVLGYYIFRETQSKQRLF